MKNYVFFTGIISALGIILIIEDIKLAGFLVYNIGTLLLLICGTKENRMLRNANIEVKKSILRRNNND